MAVQYMNNGGGGGLFSRVLPTLLGAAGSAVGGPMGGMLGRAGGNFVTGNWPNSALDIIRGLGGNANAPAAPDMPPGARFNPGFSFTDELWGKDKPWRFM